MPDGVGAMRAIRHGFTLIELLVVIAIVALLIGLVLPAVEKVREAAARTKCSNNLKQIGLAMHDYHGALGQFPPGYVATNPGPGLSDDHGPGWGWGTLLLPYLEQDALYRRINLTTDIADPANKAARTASVSIFLCPSDPGDAVFTVDRRGDGEPYANPLTDSAGNPVRVAHANYVGMFGNPEVTPDPGFLSPDADRGLARRGMLYRNSVVRFADVSDGTSNTLFVGERSTNLGYATWVGAVTGGQVPAKVPDSFGFGPEGAPLLVLGHTGDDADVPPHTPNSAVAHVDDFWSFHTQGAKFLMVDGSVRTINDSINPIVWWALGTRAGGEPVSLPD
ncbi:MAG TPA: DUF1559 domain-containing protein [Gemmataceae bacterium]|jgi:prepilin-type N-terminal cleavage/methylation domain-containing protein